MSSSKQLSSMLALFLPAVILADVVLVSFDGKGPSHQFKELNDPVMGGKSTGTWSIVQSKYGVFDGEVVNVPKLKAPGFIKTAADGSFPDASSGAGGEMRLVVRSSTPGYAGFRVTFAAGTMAPSYSCAGGGTIPFSRGCFKAKFSVPAGSEFTTVRVPLTAFSDMWSSATGEHTKDCTADKSVCPTAASLKNIKRLEIWAEGVAGKVHLEVQEISVHGASTAMVEPLTMEVPARPPKQFDTCSGPVQADLRYNISTRNESMYLPKETLATAICCDSRMQSLAEPRFTFEAPDIALFSKLDKSGVTTFYDASCGLPVFRAPVNRSMADFKADTEEHGWPSFRPAELVAENIITNKSSTYVTSKCGMHLGSYLPDDKGPRWCIDLACISGHKTKQ